MMVRAIATVLLPPPALPHVAGQQKTVRRYYLRGTIASIAILLFFALGAWLISRHLFRVWLGSSMPLTRAILPLVLIHTVIGGSSAVGRAILLGMGKIRAFTASVLLAGV